MKQRTLGPESFVSSSIGLGCMGFSQGYGPVDDGESVTAIRAALDAGVDLFDTAQSYGRGHNETLLSTAISDPSVKIATKFGIVRDDAGVRLDGKPEHVAHYCDASLRRLQRDTIDLYYLHRVDPTVPIADTVGAMAELVTAGKVRHLGLSEVTKAQLDAAVAVHPITAVQFEWSMLWRVPERTLIPHARRLGVGLVPYSPLGRGLLTATLGAADIGSSPFRASDPRFDGNELTQNLAQVHRLEHLAQSAGITAGQLALAWLLSRGFDIVPVPGSRKARRVIENCDAAGVTLTEDVLRRLDDAVPADGWIGDRRSFAAAVTTRT
ncbi:aryl-alcohol dehydrogenase-like predicted oxidoreductase [Rhodococcus sp. 27YEA15]|uniref:aldo/keto reductase n=1 Tax=Rhodococcus sp. 27YEA15 TaxID=3156259 RepID=UPI003C7A4FB8